MCPHLLPNAPVSKQNGSIIPFTNQIFDRSHRSRVWIFLLLAFCWTVSIDAPCLAQDVVDSGEVSALIDQLGDDSYVIRTQAKEKLQQLGLEAFEELQAAQFHPDSEIVSAARFLINSFLVSWSKETDPAEVRAALFEYSAQDIDERGSRIQRIAALPDRQGVDALVRVARYDPEPSLNRQAALALMQQPMSPNVTECRRQAEMIRQVLGKSDRQSSQWLRVYAQDLQDQSYSVDPWRKLIKQQRREIDANTSQQTTRASVLSLVRTCAGRAAEMGERDEAISISNQNIDLIPPTTRDLVEACNWASDTRLHEFVLELQQANSRLFSGHPRLLYGAAEAKLVGGNDAEADKLATQALAIRAFPKTEKDKEKLSDDDIDGIAQAHLLLAQELLERGLFDWAEGEYQSILDGVEVTSVTGARTRRYMSEMIGELLRHKDAIAILEPLVDRVRKDDLLRKRLNASYVRLAFMEGKLEFHRAMVAKGDGQMEQARLLLKQSFDTYPDNVDVLIEMYRTEGDEDWKGMVERLVRFRTQQVDASVREKENLHRRFGKQLGSTELLSQYLNEYAWLVSNTTGDYEKALAASKRSLELMPDDAAMLDTLARCYLALGRYEEAAEAQQRALDLMPHSPPMVRQMKEIQSLLE
ncbi:tetratricopeptide repeat protein [Planctomycetes bacterium K23_9]|uniref:Tetratricopeptide repeat protein n=1 Tax=Stieleria marina TaxID=1930275 RepID=A0A517NTJ3_9BACT|nr:Tetratricopeptide repeat protein [Planctomycetes bacterium K23_9]